MENELEDSPERPRRIDIEIMVDVATRIQRAQSDVEKLVGQLASSILQLQEERQRLARQLVEAAVFATKRIQESIPRNWPTTGLSGVWNVMEEEGIPLAYIPRAEIVGRILAEPDYEARLRVLQSHWPDIAEDCVSAINSRQLHAAIADLGDFLHEAIEVLSAGKFASAQSLAVNLADTMIRRILPSGRKYWRYGDMKNLIRESSFDDEILTFSLSLRPLLSFYTNWRPGDLTPPPKNVSRHRTAHDVSPDHMSELHAIVAVMLSTSLALGVSDFCTWVEMHAKDGDGQ